MLQTIVVGLVEGGVYALSAVGLVLIFSVAGVANLAHGESVVVGGLVAYAAGTYAHVPYVLSIVVGAAAATVLGLILSLVFDRLRDAAETGVLMASLGLILIIEAFGVTVFGDEPKSVPAAPGHVLDLGGVRIPAVWAVIVVTAFVLTGLLRLYISASRPGRAMRAMAMNPYAATLMGIARRRYAMLAFAIGSCVAGIAGALLASAFPIGATSGEDIAFKAFIVIIFAGLGSIGGALAGGLLLGVIGAVASSYIDSGYANTFLFAFLLIVIVLRPNGLFGVNVARD
ncbi:MAG TPA: branched-chain amino acid ABC transporter permease [Amycolatopsis sp.]|nr:branched-chain amino acid ABC transporter permease [Amycolatopsis sp.]